MAGPGDELLGLVKAMISAPRAAIRRVRRPAPQAMSSTIWPDRRSNSRSCAGSTRRSWVALPLRMAASHQSLPGPVATSPGLGPGR